MNSRDKLIEELEQLAKDICDASNINMEYTDLVYRAITQLKADGEEIERLREEQDDTLEQLKETILAGREWMKKAETLKAENERLRGELEEARGNAEYFKGRFQKEAFAYRDAVDERDTLQKQNAELREGLEKIRYDHRGEGSDDWRRLRDWMLWAKGVASQALTPQPNLPSDVIQPQKQNNASPTSLVCIDRCEVDIHADCQPKKEECPECGGVGRIIYDTGAVAGDQNITDEIPCPKCGGKDE